MVILGMVYGCFNHMTSQEWGDTPTFRAKPYFFEAFDDNSPQLSEAIHTGLSPLFHDGSSVLPFWSQLSWSNHTNWASLNMCNFRLKLAIRWDEDDIDDIIDDDDDDDDEDDDEDEDDEDEEEEEDDNDDDDDDEDDDDDDDDEDDDDDDDDGDDDDDDDDDDDGDDDDLRMRRMRRMRSKLIKACQSH